MLMLASRESALVAVEREQRHHTQRDRPVRRHADGEIEQKPDLAEVRRGLEAARSAGIEAGAISAFQA